MKVISTKIEARGSNDIAIFGAQSSVAKHVSLFVKKVSLVEQALDELDPFGPRMRNLKGGFFFFDSPFPLRVSLHAGGTVKQRSG